MDIWTSVIVIALLIFVNGMFVAAEFAIIGVRPTRIEQLADEGNPTAKRLRRVLKNPALVDRYIATAQLGITLASLGLGMVGEPAIAHFIEPLLHDTLGLSEELLHSVSFLIGLIIITYLHVVVGEMVPKSLALQSAERAVFALATPMLLMQTVFSYPITALNRIGVWTLRLFRVRPPESGSRLHTPDELELIISESVVGGLIDIEERDLFSNIFEFAELRANQVMIPRLKVEAVPVTITEAQLLEKIHASNHSRFPVYEETLDNIIGLIHLKDVVNQQLKGEPFDLRRILHEIPVVPEPTPVDRLLAILKKEQVHMAVVLDEYGGTAGIVTMQDLIEEVMGEVRDEFDTDESAAITLVKPGHLLVDGTVRIDEIREYVDLKETEADVDSIGGLVITHLNLPAQVGDEARIDGVIFRVEEVNGLALERLSIFFDSSPVDQSSAAEG